MSDVQPILQPLSDHPEVRLPDPILPGTTGTVTAVRRYGSGRDIWHQVDVDWDNGRKLMLVVPPDEFEVLADSAKSSTLARHSDTRLTLGVYTHVEPHDQQAAIKAWPAPPAKAEREADEPPRLGLVG